MAITPPALVTGTARTALPYGLFSVVPFRENSADRWEGGGVTVEGLGCLNLDDGHLIGVPSCDPEGEPTPGLPKTFEEGGLGTNDAEPFTVYDSFNCTPVGVGVERAQQLALDRLASREEARAEAGFAAQILADDDLVTLDGAGSLKAAIAALEVAVARGWGALGVFHMSRATATLAMERGLVKERGGRLFTLLGTPVVAGTGYAFEGILATTALVGYRSAPFTSTGRPYDLLDRETNDLYAIAERAYLLAYEDCGPWQIEFTETEGGGVDPETLARIEELETTVAAQASEIASLTAATEANTSAITEATAAISANETAIEGKADAAHTHSAADITSGSLAAARIPTLAQSKVSGLADALGEKVTSVEAGDGILVDSTTPTAPIISLDPAALPDPADQ